MKTTAAVATAPKSPFTIEDLELDAVQPGELRVRMVASGVCHTDAAVRDQVYPTPLPLVLGHEGAGIVEEVGAGVEGFAEGDHVILSYNSCGHCRACAEGTPSYCDTFFELNIGGARPDGSTALSRDGERVSSHFFGQSSFAQHANVSARCAVKVDDDAPLELLGPPGLRHPDRRGRRAERPAAPPGLLDRHLRRRRRGPLRAHGGQGVPVQPDHRRGHGARAPGPGRGPGATHTIFGGQPVAEQIREITGGGAEFAVDTTAFAPIFGDIVGGLAGRGVLGVVGVTAPGTQVSFDIGSSLPKGVTIKTIVEGESVQPVFIPQLMALHAAGLFPFDKLVKTYPFDQINQAFEDSHSGATIKPVLLFPQD